MNHRGYPSTSVTIRSKLEALIMLPDSAPEWATFIQTEMRIAAWMMPAVQAAVRQGGWRTAADPVVQIRATVHRLAIEMRLKNPINTNLPIDPEQE